jgi:hypothetical protein
MAYNFFNLGIVGEEIKRRLNLLTHITGTDTFGKNNVAASTKYVQEMLNVKQSDERVYIDAGEVT